jgi:ketosteroid isomerase-like protein
MSVNELQALTQKFADAFDQRDLQPVMEMLEAVAGLVSASFGFRQPSCRVYGDTVGIVIAYDMFTGVTKDGKARSIHGRTTLVFLKQSGQWKIVSAHFSAMP